MADCMDAVCQHRESLVVFKRDVQLCIIGVFPVWAAMFAISGCRSLLQSFEDSFLELVTVENPKITVGIFDAIYRSCRDTSISGLGGHIAISGFRLLTQSLGTVSLNSPLWQTPELSLKFRHYLS